MIVLGLGMSALVALLLNTAKTINEIERISVEQDRLVELCKKVG